jgi:cellulose synthase/poly-beta-1,6-N-acetylglucosamine synthase-like glycosyltransferase
MLRREGTPSHSPKVSVIVPVLRRANTLDDTLRKLTSDSYPFREIIVAVDEPAEETLEIIQRYGRDVRFDISEKRRGKVNAMENCFRSSTGDVIVFLDSDIVIRTPDLISKTAAEMEGCDLLEMKKGVVQEGLLSQMVYYEYIGFNAANWILARRMNKTLGVNGAGFAITREAYERIGGFRTVVSEDLDLGLRGYLNDLKFKYANDILVDTFAPASLKGWWVQRKRWSYGTALWFRDNYRPLLTALKQHPGVFLTALIMIFPTILSVLFGLAFKNAATFDLFALFMLSISSRSFPIIIPPLIPYAALPDIFSMFLAMLVGLASYSVAYIAFTRKLGYKFRLHHFILYYLVYSPLWFIAMVWGLLQVCVRREAVQIDWKV